MEITLIFSHLNIYNLCYTKFHFAQKRGGALIVLLLSMGALWAQSPTCNQFYLEVCESPQPPGSIGTDCMDGNGCQPVYYYFYLRSSGSVGGGSTNITFRQLNIVGQLNAVPNLLATSKVLSKLNKDRSLACSPPEINNQFDPASPLLSVQADGTFSYLVIHENELDITWTLTDNRRLLFVIAIDPFPGELVSVGNINFSFLLPSGINCTGNVFYCNPLGGLASKVVDVPAACTNGLLIRFGTPINDPVPGYPMRKRIPVIVTSADNSPTLYSIDKLDFLSRLTTTQQMADIFIEGGKIPLDDIRFYNEFPNNSTNRRIYANTENIQLLVSKLTGPTLGNTLFTIIANGPALESDCATINLFFTDYLRMVMAGNCCRPLSGASTAVSWNTGDCPDYCTVTTISVAEATSNLPALADCEDAFLDVFIESSSTVSYEEASVSLYLDHSGVLNWTAVNSFSDYCSNMPFCVSTTTISSTRLRVDFSIDGATLINLSPGIGVKNLVRLAFTGQDFCISSVTVADALLRRFNSPSYCLPTATSAISETTNDDDICVKSLVFKYEIYDGSPMKEIDYSIDLGICLPNGTANDFGSKAICPCFGNNQKFTPTKDDNPLNGLTTYDLVLISKHILGIEPLGSPYKMIAADANKSNSITTFDIVEFRKLILGIYTELPANTSWRFLLQSFAFPDPNFPFFYIPFPEDATFSIPPSDNEVAFYGIKIGDVNNTVVQRPAALPPATLAYGDISGAAGDQIEAPVFALEGLEQAAWQMTLRYDTTRSRLLGLRWPSGLLPFQGREWYEPQRGEVRVLWYDGEGKGRSIAAGSPLFYLQLECLAPLTDAGLLLDQQTPALGYSAAGAESRFELSRASMQLLQRETPVAVEALPWTAGVYPNPAGNHFRLELTLPKATTCQVGIFDLYGRLLWEKQWQAESGHQSLNETPALPAGQYLLRFSTDWGNKTQRLIKQ